MVSAADAPKDWDDVLDTILEDYVEDLHTAEQIAADHNYDLALVRKVIRMVDGAEYKRQQAAPGLKVTTKAFGIGLVLTLVSGDPRFFLLKNSIITGTIGCSPGKISKPSFVISRRKCVRHSVTPIV